MISKQILYSSIEWREREREIGSPQIAAVRGRVPEWAIFGRGQGRLSYGWKWQWAGFQPDPVRIFNGCCGGNLH